MEIGTGDEAFPFEIGLIVRPCNELFTFVNDCGVIDTPPPIYLVTFDAGVGIGLNVILLLTPVTGNTFAVEAVTCLGVTVSSLFLVIAVTASLAASLALDALDWIGFRMIAGIG